ncbi:unnamed protein product [Cladocopium goreaui]|uniref:ATP-dependent DNA helicase n=1 Tax=Cladocopium goreaui TaxID=2562237 RepID=A0A9P1GRM8_9DINO|nr:unnamed protein product [Cladocopium goreaui]
MAKAARPKRASRKPRRAPRGQSWKKRGRRIRSRVAEESGEEMVQEDGPHVKEEPILFEHLTAEQQDAARRALRGENLFLTGAAGTGKSFLLRYLIQELEQRFPEQVAVTASTGVAASHLAGQTLHSFAGIGIGCSTLRMALKKVRQTSGAEARWTQTRVLVVDEISMVDAKLLDLLEGLACNLRGNRQAFGGMQVLLCGDFLQLPPVQERGGGARSFCFTANAWQKANLQQGTVLLREPVRQQSDSDFAEVLNDMRLGIVSEKAKAMLESCHVDLKPLPSDDILPTKLYCSSADIHDRFVLA